jgi:hypothetical protein
MGLLDEACRASEQNGWLHICETTLYVTTDDSDPTEHNYAFQGTSPLRFLLHKPCRIKACAITSDHHASSVTEKQVSLCESGGIGLLLEKKGKYAGVLVQKIQPGGSAWEQGSIEVPLPLPSSTPFPPPPFSIFPPPPPSDSVGAYGENFEPAGRRRVRDDRLDLHPWIGVGASRSTPNRTGGLQRQTPHPPTSGRARSGIFCDADEE